MNLGSLRTWFKGGFDKWRLGFMVFAASYVLFLVFGFMGIHGLSYMSPQWDEVTHLNGALFLLHGEFSTYFSANSFYPPMYNLATLSLFSVAGQSVFTGRLVSVAFSLLSLFALFEFARHIYGGRTAFLSSIILGIMPGFLYLSRVAMIETMLVFFFTVAALSFFVWLQEHRTSYLYLSGLALGLGFLTKYQIVIIVPIMLTSLVVLGRGYLKKRLNRFPLAILIAVAVVLPWIVLSYQVYADKMLSQWLYAMDIGNPHQTIYSTGLNRFPQFFSQFPNWLQTSTFYLFEMTVPYSDIHPVSVLLYFLGLAGLGWFAVRRRPEDKYLLIWFIAVYAFFTFIPNKDWRYMIPVFPVLALSAANFVTSAVDKALKLFKMGRLDKKKKMAVKAATATLIIFTLTSSVISLSNAYYWVSKDQVHIPVQEATHYVVQRIGENKSVVVLCAQDLFSQDTVRFFLSIDGKTNQVWQYPELPVDAYTPHFNVTEFISLCKLHNVEYVLICEHRDTVPFFNSTLDLHDVYTVINSSGEFSEISNKTSFGTSPNRIFLINFLG